MIMNLPFDVWHKCVFVLFLKVYKFQEKKLVYFNAKKERSDFFPIRDSRFAKHTEKARIKRDDCIYLNWYLRISYSAGRFMWTIKRKRMYESNEIFAWWFCIVARFRIGRNYSSALLLCLLFVFAIWFFSLLFGWKQTYEDDDFVKRA